MYVYFRILLTYEYAPTYLLPREFKHLCYKIENSYNKKVILHYCAYLLYSYSNKLQQVVNTWDEIIHN